jgi:LmbE family N-acetylglucosaminyl deacetylase
MNAIATSLAVLASLGSAVAVLIVLLVGRRMALYRQAISYKVDADHDLRGARSSRTVDLQFVDGKTLTWAVDAPRCSAALLEVCIRTTLIGRLTDPCIEARIGPHFLRNYFERGASGRRYLNVTELVRQASHHSTVELRTRFVKLASETARLHIYEAEESKRGPLLVIAPHPDDAEIAAFGLMMRHDSWVMTVTLGDNGPSQYAEYFETDRDAYLEKAYVRTWDSLVVPQLAGVPANQIGNLGYFDGTLRQMHACPDTPVAAVFTGATDVRGARRHPFDSDRSPRPATWHNLVDDMRKLLDGVRPATIVAPHPELDPHDDHRFSTIAMLEALETFPIEGCLLLYVNHAIGSELWPYGPNDGEVSVPPSSSGAGSCSGVLSVPLDRPAQLRKRLAIEAHHDLQPPPSMRATNLFAAVRRAMRDVYCFIVQPESTYVRRAVRPNEMFFVVDFSNAAKLRRAALRNDQNERVDAI